MRKNLTRNGARSSDRARWKDPDVLRVGKQGTSLLIAVALTLFLASSCDNETVLVSSAGTWLALLLLLACLRLLMSHNELRTLWQGEPPSGKASIDGLSGFITLAENTYRKRHKQPELLKGFIGLLIDPSGYFDQISETIAIKPTWYESTTALNFVPRVDSESLVPVLVQRKQKLVDGLSVTVDGSPASILSYVENQGAILLSISAIYAQFARNDDKSIILLKRIKDCIASPNAEDSKQIVKDLEREFREQSRPAPGSSETDGAVGPLESPWLDIMIRLVQFCAHSYFMLCLVRPDQRSLSHRIVIARRFVPMRQTMKLTVVLRTALGLGWKSHTLSLGRATEARSYHLTLEPPEDMYVYRTRYREVDASEPPDQAMPLPTRRALLPDQVQSSTPQHFHIYLRDRDDSERDGRSRDRLLDLVLRETPPALLEAGLLLSLYLTTTVWVVGMNHDDIFGASSPTTWSAVFGIPTLLSGWLVARIDYKTMSRMSGGSLIMTVWLAVNSGTAVFAAAFKSSELWTEDPESLLFLNLDDSLWGALMLVTALHLALNLVLVITRMGKYVYALRSATASKD